MRCETPERRDGPAIVAQLIIRSEHAAPSCCFDVQRSPLSPARSLMTSSQLSLLDADQHRWTELSDMPNDPCRSRVWSKTDCKPFERTLFNIQAQWSPRFISHSIRVDPLFRSAWFSALGRRRFYYPFVLAVMVRGVAVSAVDWRMDWCVHPTGPRVVCVWMPLVLVECTRLDRYLLGLLIRSWDFCILFTNWCTGQVSSSCVAARVFQPTRCSTASRSISDSGASLR